MIGPDLLSRRNFFGAATVALALTRESLVEAQDEKPATPVNVGLIGTGQHGQLLLARLARVAGANVVALADTYEPNLKKASEVAPKAAAGSEYRAVIDKADAIIIATPTCLHRQIALDAIAAGKHVYLEAPLAVTLEETKAIAKAGNESKKVFMTGLHQRANALYLHALKFYRSGQLDRTSSARAQFHRKTSWRRPAPNPANEKMLNWKLDRTRSNGLLGEFGTHQLDTISWFLRRPPTAVIGYGALKSWDDGRDVPDTVQAIFEYPNEIRVLYEATLTNSFDASYEVIAGNNGTMLLRTDRAWIIKEADSPVLGWEVYARVDKLCDEEGITLVADASKLIARGLDPAKEGEKARAGKDAYYDAMEEFLMSIRENRKPAAGAAEGLQATVVGIRAAEAVVSGAKVSIAREDLTL